MTRATPMTQAGRVLLLLVAKDSGGSGVCVFPFFLMFSFTNATAVVLEKYMDIARFIAARSPLQQLVLRLASTYRKPKLGFGCWLIACLYIGGGHARHRAARAELPFASLVPIKTARKTVDVAM